MDPFRVLVVDDEEDLVGALVERLRLRGVDAHGETRGQAGLARLRAGGFDVVLLDVKMPGLGGLEVVREIQKLEQRVAVVLLTGHGSEQDAEEGLRLGVFAYLMKPVQIEDLMEILRAAAGRAGAPT